MDNLTNEDIILTQIVIGQILIPECKIEIDNNQKERLLRIYGILEKELNFYRK